MPYTTIKKPSDYFNTKLYTGNGTSQSITGVGFQPDWLWIKCRNFANGHALFDVQRTTYSLSTENTAAEVDRSSDGFTSLDSDGFTLNGSGAGGRVNVSGRTYASWNWLGANGTASNTDGSITSTVSASTVSGFSIVSYTGTGSNATVGHGLGSAPKVVITKNRDGTGNWEVYHGSISGMSGGFIELNQTTAFTGGSYGVWNGDPNSSTFGIGTNVASNTSGANYIAYCFAEKKGFSKFGSYTGNFNSDGTFVYTGFKPAFIMIKSSSVSSDWNIWDNKRPGYNVVNMSLEPHQNDAETVSAGRDIDILSNGFKSRGTSSSMNGSGETYIYMAFAEEPLVGDNPATAR